MVSVGSLINVQISLAAAAAAGQNLTNLLCVTSNLVVDLKQRLREYTSSAAVAVDFGENGLEYAAAVLAFAQTPQISNFYVGRWAQNAAQGQLIGAPLTAAQQAIANFTAVGADGGFSISIDGAGVEHIAEINLSAVVTLQGVAGAITTALAGAAVCTWNPVEGNFIFTSATTGATSAVSFLTANTAGGVTDISTLLGGAASESGSYVVQGQVAESALACATLFDSQFGNLWYALMMPSITNDADHMAVFGYCQSSTRKHFYGATTSEAGVLVPTYTTDLAYMASQAGFTKGMVQYSSTNACAVASPIARILTVNYAAANTAINLMWQTCPNLLPEPNLSTDAQAALTAKNCNVYAATDQSGSPIFLTGTTPSTDVFIDTVIGADNFAVDLQTALFGAFTLAAVTPGKIGFTDAGMHVLVTATIGVCDEYATNGFLGASGTWPGGGFGSLKTGQVPPCEGCYYVYAAPVATASQQVKQSRMAVPIQVAGLLAGAINTAAVLVTLVP
jgi:hypothetical protein